MRAFRLLIASLLIALGAPAFAQGGYQIGDRLKPAPAAQGSPRAAYADIDFYALSPPGWNPMAGFNKEALASMRDNDPRAAGVLAKMREAWDKAPVMPALDRKRVRIAGFLVPLDADGDTMREFLLVPYFGACIHVPPPPPNQVIHVIMDKPFKARMMEPFWISGEMRIARSDNPLGAAAYRLQGQRAEPYRQPGTPWQ
ncbi:MAG: DUF3299 domain-containing protein [Candidatus Dactylopiibacterium sp.]|nr:DUF3299 domain-containing protein [Candidatus Dactylopiibacterium sp.]